jgi:hypothetical protein
LEHEARVNFISIATQMKNWIMTGTDHTLRIFEVEEATGKCSLRGTFEHTNSPITTAHFAYGNK